MAYAFFSIPYCFAAFLGDGNFATLKRPPFAP